MSKCNLAYVLQAQDETGYVKVGMTSDVERRLKQLRTWLPFTLKLVAIMSNGKAAEAEMKSLLSEWQTRGEWFLPRQELNDFLIAKRKANCLLERVPVDDAYCEAFIRPVAIGYLAGREPLMNHAGDLMARFLREGAKAIAGREDVFSAAVRDEISAEVLQGYVPLREGEPTPLVAIPGQVNTAHKNSEAA